MGGVALWTQGSPSSSGEGGSHEDDEEDDAPRQPPAQGIDPSASLYSWEILPELKNNNTVQRI